MTQGSAHKPTLPLGAISLCLAVASFIAVPVSLASLGQTPLRAGPIEGVLVVVFVVAPILHVVGLILGFVAMLRPGPGDRLGLLGAGVNASAIIMGGYVARLMLR